MRSPSRNRVGRALAAFARIARRWLRGDARPASPVIQMPLDVRRWFAEKEYARPSYQDQDWDLVLAQWELVPQLLEFAADEGKLLEKRFEALSALLVLQGDAKDDAKRGLVTEQIRKLVLSNREFAREAASQWFGVVEAVVVLSILGEVNPEMPEWVVARANQRLGAGGRGGGK